MKEVGGARALEAEDRSAENAGRSVEGALVTGELDRLEREEELPARLGAWYWVRDKGGYWDDPAERGKTIDHIGCVTHIGSNFVEMTYPSPSGTMVSRILFKNFVPPKVRPVADPAQVFRARVETHQAEVTRLMGVVQALFARIGVDTGDKPALGAPSGQGLMVMSGAVDIGRYKHELVEAKEKQLPDLFKLIEAENKKMAAWMQAPLLELEAQVKPLRARISAIDERIFAVELYAGLTEQVVCVAEGDPAGREERLHLMQLRRYMDQECLLAYDNGGMDVKNLAQFSSWLARPENRDRLLPHPRCLIAMRVRNYEKEREWDGSIRTLMGNLELSQADKLTFLFIRNGDQLWRLSSALQFEEFLFPDSETNRFAGPLMIARDRFGLRGDSLVMSVGLHAELTTEYQAWQRKRDDWRAANPGVREFDMPYEISEGRPRWDHRDFDPEHWEPFSPEVVNYDDAMAAISAEIASYNRIALILQGLFDRSPVLHPHPPVKLWNPDGFAAAVALVFDGSRALHASAEPPDFEEYRRRCNASLGEGSLVTGVDPLWTAREAKRENDRRSRDWRSRNESRPRHFRPYGDPGPGLVATVGAWAPRARKGTVRWTRVSRSWRWDRTADAIPATLEFQSDQVFNVSAYRPGDYKLFFGDPRTREKYLQWAPLLMAAEDWHAGRLAERADMPGIWDRATGPGTSE